MTLLDHVVLQVDDLNAIGDWYDQIVSLAGGSNLRYAEPDRVRPAWPASPAVLLAGDRPRWSPDPRCAQGRGRGDRPTRPRVRRRSPAPRSSTSLGCGRSTDRTTTRCSSATRPETTSNSGSSLHRTANALDVTHRAPAERRAVPSRPRRIHQRTAPGIPAHRHRQPAHLRKETETAEGSARKPG